MAPLIEKHIRLRGRRDEKKSFGWQIAKGIFRLALIATFFTLVWYVTRLPFFTITTVDVSGGETVSHDTVRAVVERELAGTYVFLIPHRFLYLYPHDGIAAALLHDTRIYDVAVTRSPRQTLAVSFKEYIPTALWCTEDETVPCYFMTESGYAFSEAPLLTGGALVRHVGEGVRGLVPGDVIPWLTLENLSTFIVRLRNELGFRVSSVYHRQNGDVVFRVNGGGEIFVTPKNDLNVAFENLRAVLASSEFKHLKPGNFRYIDVRFNEKAYVNEKLTNDVATSTATTTDVEE